MIAQNRVAAILAERQTAAFAEGSGSFAGVFRRLRTLVEEGPAEWDITSAGNRKFRLLVAGTPELRERAYRLGARIYKQMGYLPADGPELLVSKYDARPDTFTLLVADEDDRDVATLTLVFDGSEDGLPLDDVYRPEADRLRVRGKHLAEIVRLAVDGPRGGSREVLLHLFNFAYIYAKCVKNCDGFLITVNPHHVPFYVRSWGFEVVGAERACPKVQDAPAVLLHLCFVYVAARAWREAGRPAQSGDRSSLYPNAYPPEAEPFIAAFLKHRHKPMTTEEAERLGLTTVPAAELQG